MMQDGRIALGTASRVAEALCLAHCNPVQEADTRWV